MKIVTPSCFTPCLFSPNWIIIVTLSLIMGCAVPLPDMEFKNYSAHTNAEFDTYASASQQLRDYAQFLAKNNQQIIYEIARGKNDSLAIQARTVQSNTRKLSSAIDKFWERLVIQTGGKDQNGFPLIPDQKAKSGTQEIETLATDLIYEFKEFKSGNLLFVPEGEKEKWLNQLPLAMKDRTWPYEKMDQLSIGVMQMALEELQTQILQIEEQLLLQFLKQSGGTVPVFQQYEIVSVPHKSYVIKGDTYEADIFLTPVYASEDPELTNIIVNGQRLAMKDGKAKYTTTTSRTGEIEYNAQIKMVNPVDGNTETFSEQFHYEVGERSISTMADKMNVFYVGVDNPVSISAAGVPSDQLKVSITGGGASLVKAGLSRYNVRATRPTPFGEPCMIHVTAGEMTSKFHFRVKRIPDPVAQLGKSSGGKIGIAEFRAQQGVIAILKNFDFDAVCKIQGFTISRIREGAISSDIVNRGARYSSKAMTLIQEAQPGDIYIFDNIKGRCPGDPAGRKLNSMVFMVR